jgi:flagellar biosynthesis anti-sigma factor FlgM
MSAINGIGASSSLQKVINNPVQKQLPAQPATQAHANKLTDKVQLSGGVSHLLQTLKAGGDIRADKVASIRQQLDAGTYETEARLDAAIDRLMDDLAR